MTPHTNAVHLAASAPLETLSPRAEPIKTRAGIVQRARTMARVGVRMMFFDKLKLLGTMLGVVFAVVLSNQQLGTFLGLIYKNQMLVEKTNADLWILPAGDRKSVV